MKAKRVVRIGFDSFENHNPEFQEELGIFVDDPDTVPKGKCRVKGMTAHAKIQAFFYNREPEKMYVGYDNNVYPQFRIEDTEVS